MNIEKVQIILFKAIKAAHIMGDSYLAEQIQEVSAAVDKFYSPPSVYGEVSSPTSADPHSATHS